MKSGVQKLRLKFNKLIVFSALFSFLSFFTGMVIAQYRTSLEIASQDSVLFTPVRFDRPELKYFVMSFCPQANQFELTLRPVYELLKTKVDFVPHYLFYKVSDLPSFCRQRYGDIDLCPKYIDSKIFATLSDCRRTVGDNNSRCLDPKGYLRAGSGVFYTSVAGRQEASQSVREICAWRQTGEDKTPWWEFITGVNSDCTADNADSCWSTQAQKAGLDINKITECFNLNAFSIIETEMMEAVKYQARGGPAVAINNIHFPPDNALTQNNNGRMTIGRKTVTQDRYRTPEVIKQGICASFKKAPAVCKSVLADIPGIIPDNGGCSNL